MRFSERVNIYFVPAEEEAFEHDFVFESLQDLNFIITNPCLKNRCNVL